MKEDDFLKAIAAQQKQINLIADTITGKLLATQAAIRAIIKIHPDLLPVIAAELEQWHSDGLNTIASDEMLQGFEKAKHAILPVID